jgi:hypothetical protein
MHVEKGVSSCIVSKQGHDNVRNNRGLRSQLAFVKVICKKEVKQGGGSCS